MSWLPAAAGATTPLEGALGWNPALLEKFTVFHATLWDDSLLGPDLLELLRVRIAQVHDCAAELAVTHDGADLSAAKRAALADWQASDLFDDGERALLAYAEAIPFRHQFIEPETVAEAQRHLDARGLVAFTLAVTLFDALCRLRMTFGLVVEPGVVPAPSAGGALH